MVASIDAFLWGDAIMPPLLTALGGGLVALGLHIYRSARHPKGKTDALLRAAVLASFAIAILLMLGLIADMWVIAGRNLGRHAAAAHSSFRIPLA